MVEVTVGEAAAEAVVEAAASTCGGSSSYKLGNRWSMYTRDPLGHTSSAIWRPWQEHTGSDPPAIRSDSSATGISQI